MKKLTILIVILFVAVSCSKDDFEQEKNVSELQSQMQEKNEQPVDGDITTRNIELHDVLFVPGPNSCNITITNCHLSCYPLSYNYEIWAYGLLMNQGAGTSIYPEFNIETCPSASYRIEFHGHCNSDSYFYSVFDVGGGAGSTICDYKFNEITTMRSGESVCLSFLMVNPSLANHTMNPKSYELLRNRSVIGQGTIVGSSTMIPLSKFDGYTEIRVYGDACTCTNKNLHYTSFFF